MSLIGLLDIWHMTSCRWSQLLMINMKHFSLENRGDIELFRHFDDGWIDKWTYGAIPYVAIMTEQINTSSVVCNNRRSQNYELPTLPLFQYGSLLLWEKSGHIVTCFIHSSSDFHQILHILSYNLQENITVIIKL